ncbi:TlpA disulfide reductase family protein [uncultured Coprobacter sp.]|uniref:TlpA disulfide reductase family protein n=1 Tax=Coprobacter secundus TaxID=1501392 RepID=UPI002594F573|nr:TlpA disulfide reductase family protein [uncultured Coprobacter sp.]
MYSKIISGVLILTITLSCSDNYNIEGTIDPIANGDIVILQKQQGQSFINIDSAHIKDGHFSFKGRQDTATMALISISGKDKLPFTPLLFILENGNLRARIDTLSSISGTELNDKFQNYMDDRSFLDIKLEQLSRQYVTTYVKGQLTDSLFVRLQKEFGEYETQLKDLTRNYILNNTNNISGVYLFIQNSFLFPPETQKEIIENGGEFFEHNPAIQTFSKLLSMNKNVEISMPYINLKMQTPSGSPVTLSDYIQKGKYVLIDFWASWCAPCRKQMPELIKIYDRFKNKNFEIVGVSFDNSKNEWVEYINDMKISWPQMSDLKGWDSDAIMLYAIQGIPHTVLVNPRGIIIAKDLKGKELISTLNKLLK